MATFKIRDLMVSLDPEGRRAVPEQRHHNLIQAEVPCACTGTVDPGGCPHSYNIVVAGGSPGAAIEKVPSEALPRLRAQLEELLLQVKRRQAKET
jgi:hypothetical protein